MEKQNVKVTLSMEELTELMSIADPAKRREALDAIGRCAADPAGEVKESSCGAVRAVVDRMRKCADRRARAAARRLQARKVAAPAPPSAPSTTEVREYKMGLDEAMARRLLWLNQHYGEWVDHVTRILRIFQDWGFGEHLSETVKTMTDVLIKYINPLIGCARDYMKMPRRMRPRAMKVALPYIP